MKIKIFLFILLFFIQLAFSGAAPIGKNNLFMQLTTKYTSSDKYYDPGGKVNTIPTTTEIVNSIYTEYGFSDKLSVVLNFPFYKNFVVNKQIRRNQIIGQSTGNGTGIKIQGLGDTDIGLKIGLPQWKFFQSNLTLGASIPLSEFQSNSNETSPIPTGHDDTPFNIMFESELVHPYPRFDLTVQLGIKLRQTNFIKSDYSDSFQYGLKFGKSFWGAYWILSGFGELPLGNGDESKDPQYLAFGPTVYYGLHQNFGITAGLESAAWNKNTLSALAYKGGVYLNI